MGDLVPRERLLAKQIQADAERELRRVYQLTAGFVDPEPPAFIISEADGRILKEMMTGVRADDGPGVD